jgi:hypothetical protein
MADAAFVSAWDDASGAVGPDGGSRGNAASTPALAREVAARRIQHV